VIFSNLTKADIKKIVVNMLKDVQKRLDEHEIKLSVSDSAVGYLVEKGFDEEYGARPLRRLIQKDLENVLSSMIIAGKLVNGSKVDVGVRKDSLDIKIKEKVTVKS
jgi:ATP-dependent Clp protease ATP-binding subunit ClpA